MIAELGTRCFWVSRLRFRAPSGTLLRSFFCLKFRTFAFALLVFRARIFALLIFCARTFTLLISFHATGFLSRSQFPFANVCLYIYTHTHTYIHPHTHPYIPTHIYTPPHLRTLPHFSCRSISGQNATDFTSRTILATDFASYACHCQ